MSGMLDDKSKRYPDIGGIMQSFKVNQNKVGGGKIWFMKMVPNVIKDFYNSGEILESFYDAINYPMDMDVNNTIYTLNRNADNMTRSKVLYYPTVLSDKGRL